MDIKRFFRDAFHDVKEDAKAQHEVDKVRFEAVKAESRANFEKAKAEGSSAKRKEKVRAEREAQIAEARERIARANSGSEGEKQ